MKPLVRQGFVLLAGMALGTGATLGVQSLHQHRQQHAQQPPEPPKTITTPLGLRGDPSLGSSQAPVTIVEFSDFQCPYCKRFHDQVLPSLKADYIEKGLVRFVHKDLPLPFHEFAHDAAETARCSADQRQYWSTYRALFEGQDCFACKGIKTLAETAGIPPNKLETCKKGGASRKAVNSNLSEAELQGIRATPSFVIGPSQGDKHTGLLVEGAMPWPQFKALVEEALKKSRS